MLINAQPVLLSQSGLCIFSYIAQPQELDFWLSKFVLEARMGNGEPYPPDTLYGICAGLLRYIRERRPEINIFKDPQFDGFQRTLDGEMKCL